MSRALPVRMCAGCRERATKSELLRFVVVVGGSSGVVVPDERGTAPGRGAYLHPTPTCLAEAERRRAIPRALRLDGGADIEALRQWILRQATTPHHLSSPEE